MTSAIDPRPFALPDPLANSFKTGTLLDIPRVPEDAAAINARTLDWYPCHGPQTLWHCWLVDQVSVTSIRIEQCARSERRYRDRAVLHAKLFWDEDRKHDAIKLGDRLTDDPEGIVNLLRRSPQGCDWMIDRWARLARIADVESKWNDTQRSLAFDLLGTRPEDRSGTLGESIDAEGRLIASLADLAGLARREIASLQKRKEEVAGLDTVNRALAEADYVDEPSPEIRQIRRRDAELLRQLKWYHSMIKEPVYPRNNPRMESYFEPLRKPEASPEAQPETPAAEPSSEPSASEPEAEVRVSSPKLHPPRRDEEEKAKAKKANQRRDARKRRLDRRRA